MGFDRLRRCFEEGPLRSVLRSPIRVQFALGREGTVPSATDGGSNPNEPRVAECIPHAFCGFTFHAPGRARRLRRAGSRRI